jgi:DNA-binding CsgD family transcriptional regulator/N-acetylneuraminic acid mutarotase
MNSFRTAKMRAMPDMVELSERELEILKLVATGASNKEIAQQLYISANTVKVHLRNIFAKIGVTSRTEAAMYAVNNGLVDVGGGISAPDENESINSPISTLIPPGESISILPLPAEGGVSLGRPARSEPLMRWAPIFALLLALILLIIIFDRNRPANQGLSIETPSVQWQQLPALSQARYSLAVAAFENNIYAVGGITDSGVTAVTERYNTISRQWDLLSEKPTPVGEINAAAIGGRIFIPGGLLSSGEVTDVLEIFDPVSSEWQRGAPLPSARSAYAIAALEGKLYVIGGWDGVQFVNTVYQYDPNQDVWEEMTSMPTPRGYASAVVIGSRIFVFGGYDGTAALSVNEEYSHNADVPHGNPWVSRAPLPIERYSHGVAVVADTVHVVGGINESGTPLNNLRYFPMEGEWQEIAGPLPESLQDMGIVQLGTDLFVIGGRKNGVPVAEVMSYQVIYTVSLPIIR